MLVNPSDAAYRRLQATLCAALDRADQPARAAVEEKLRRRWAGANSLRKVRHAPGCVLCFLGARHAPAPRDHVAWLPQQDHVTWWTGPLPEASTVVVFQPYTDFGNEYAQIQAYIRAYCDFWYLSLAMHSHNAVDSPAWHYPGKTAFVAVWQSEQGRVAAALDPRPLPSVNNDTWRACL